MLKSRITAIILLSFLSIFSVSAQEKKQEDSLVRLVQADTLRQMERGGRTFRRATGNAVFLHNNTYLLCDTAIWDVDRRFIEAIGSVKILQDRTELESDRMMYYIDRNLAEFRGHVVQLRDKDNNTLRTKYLDYNTKDSVAVFMNGGSMRDKDGQIIESQRGNYDSKVKVFDFLQDVNMFTDSIFIKTSSLRYESDRNFATFGRGTNAWKDKNMLSSDAGWYDRNREIFFFRRNVHVMSETQEGWCDSLYFYRNTMDVDMFGNAQVTDTTRNVSGVAGHINYVDSLSRVTMRRKPAVIARTEENGQIDTVYFGADTLMYYTVKMCDIDSLLIEQARVRKENLEIDAVSNYRRKAAEEAAQKAAEAAKNDPNRPPDNLPGKNSGQKSGGKNSGQKSEGKTSGPEQTAGKNTAAAGQMAGAVPQPVSQPDSLGLSPVDSSGISPADSLGLSSADSLGVSSPDSLGVSPADSLSGKALADSVSAPPAPDTTKIGFVTALGNVKIYRQNMQIICDSLEYSDLDSLARLFKSPMIWNEVRQQYSSDSVTAVIRNQAMEKVSLMSNAFIHIQEDSTHYDQIRAAEMMAFFDDAGQLERFDALGGSSAIFYLEENDALATANRKESKMLSAYFKDGDISRVYYFDTAASNAYPVAQMSEEDKKLKGFNWMPDKRPADRYAVTPLTPRAPQRQSYSAVPRATYEQTNIYFPGYMDNIYLQIAVRDSLAKVRERQREIERREQERLEAIRIRDSIKVADSLKVKAAADSVALADSLKHAADSLHVADSLAAADSARLAAVADSNVVLTKAQLKEKAKAERAEKKAQRLAAKEARWKALDQRDADKARLKAEKKLMKERRRKLRMLEAAAEEARKEEASLEKYKERYAAREARRKARAEARSAGKKAAPSVETAL